MGTPGCCINFTTKFEPADWIALLGILINSALAYWIVKTIQNRLTNKRVLKDHFINEIKDIRSDYKTCFNNLYSNSTNPKRIIPWFKLMNIRVDDLMTFVNSKYNINKKFLEPYQIEFRELITNNADFISHFNNDKVVFSETSRMQLIRFQQTYGKLFNSLIIAINDAR